MTTGLNLTKEDIHQVQKWLMKRSWQLVHEEGQTRKQAYHAAADELAASLGVDPKDLLAELHSLLKRLYLQPKPVRRKHKSRLAENLGNFPDLYLTWLQSHNHIADDRQLAHFTGLSYQSIQAARHKAQSQGYIFTRQAGNGYQVTQDPKAAEREQIRRQIEQLRAQAADLQNQLIQLAKPGN